MTANGLPTGSDASQSNEPIGGSLIERKLRVEQIAEAFERAWQAGASTDIDAYLKDAVDDRDRLQLLNELVLVDLEQRLIRGESAGFEQYLERFPELAYSPQAVAELASFDGRIRQQIGERVENDEFLRRLPDAASKLKAGFGGDAQARIGQAPSSMGRSADETSVQGLVEQGEADLAVPSTTAGAQRIGKYQVVRELGDGGQGTTWLVHDPDLDCHVVLKRYHHSGLEAEYYLRLEARALAKVRSPHVARCLHVDRIENGLFLVIEYVQGDPLDIYVRREQADFRRISELLAEIAQGLLDVHNAGLLHRDIKPANILVRRNGTPCLVDFGLAMPLGTDAAEDLAGTVPYMSPEQARRDTLRPSSDVFALGAVMYELLTGVRPYVGQSGREVLEKAKKAAYRPPSEVNPEIPASLAAICLKAMAPDPSQRYATADTMRAALCDYVDKASAPPIDHTVPSTGESKGEHAQLGPNPYQGLAAFTEADADRFFGRDAQIDRLWRAFAELHDPRGARAGVARVLPILGPSGSGKSSLARAGLVARLARHPLPNREGLRFLVVTPGNRPLETLALSLARLATGDAAPAEKAAEFERILRDQDSHDGCQGMRRLVDLLPNIAGSPLVLLVDQFEELFSLCHDESERRLYIENLLAASKDASGRFSAILTLRSDFLADTQDHEALNQIIAERGLIVPAMNKEELHDAIAEPARQAGRPLDDGAIELLIAETRDHEGALPLLQFALTRIWEGLRTDKSPATTLHEIGGVGGALAGEAQRIYEVLSEAEQRIARRAFLAMVQLGEGTKDTRRRARVDSVATASDDVHTVRKVVSHYTAPAVRLVTLSAEPAGGSDSAVDMMEVTHEALFDHWQLLRQWLDRSRDDIRLLRRLEDGSLRWQAQGRPDGLLWRPPDLELAVGLSQRSANDFSKLAMEFFGASHRQHVRDRRRRRAFYYATQVAALSLAVLLAGVGWLYRRSERALGEADLQRRISHSQQLALKATEQAGTHPAHAMRLVGQAFSATLERNQWPPDSTVQAMSRIVKEQDDHDARFALAETGQLQVSNVSPNGRWLVHQSPDLQVHLWDLQRAATERITLHGHNGGIRQVEVTNQWLVTLGVESDILIWDLDQSDPSFRPQALAPKAMGVESIVVSPGGRWLAARDRDQALRLWDLRAPAPRDSMTAISRPADPRAEYDQDLPAHILFDEQDRWLAIASRPLNLELWALTPELRFVGRHLEEAVPRNVGYSDLRASFTKDGRWLALWGVQNAARRRFIVRSEGNEAEYQVGKLRVWDTQQYSGAANPENPRTEIRLNSVIDSDIVHSKESPEVNADNLVLAAGGTPNRLVTFDGKNGKVWDLVSVPPRELFQLPGEAPIAISPTGRWLAAHNGEAIRLWDLNDEHITPAENRRKIVLEALERPSSDIFFTSNERWLITRSQRGNVRLWDLSHAPDVPSIDLNLYDSPAEGLYVSPNSRWLVVRSRGDLRYWDLNGTPRQLPGTDFHSAPVTAVLFPGESDQMISADAWTLRRWSPDDTSAPALLSARPEPMPSLTLSPDGRRFIEASGSSVIVWSVQEGELRHAVSDRYECGAQVVAVRTSGDSKWLAAACVNGIIYLWKTTDAPHDSWKLAGHPGEVTKLAFSPDDQRLISTGMDGAARIWTLADPGQAPAVFESHPGGICTFTISPDSKLIVARGFDETSSLWNLNQARGSHRNAAWSGDAFDAGSLAREGMELTNLDAEDELGRIWNAGFARILSDSRTAALKSGVTNVSADGQRLEPFDLNNNPSESVGIRRLVAAGYKASWFPDGTRIAYGGVAGVARSEQTSSGGIDSPIADTWLFTGAGIKILDLATRRVTSICERGKDPAVSPNGKWIICVDALKYGDYASETIWLMQPDGRGIRKLADGAFPSWAKDGKTVFYFSREKDAVCRLDVERPDAGTTFFRNPGAQYFAVSPDETMIAFGGRDGVFRIADVATGRLLHSIWLPQRGFLPAWAHGKTNAFVGFGGFDGVAAGLHVYDLNSRSLRRVASGPSTMPAWSPDDSSLAFDRRESDSSTSVWLVDQKAFHAAPSFLPGDLMPPGNWLPIGTEYRYQAANPPYRDDLDSWITPDYDDTSWPARRCTFSEPVSSKVDPDEPPKSAGRLRIRTSFVAPAPADWKNPMLCIRTAGAIQGVYLNGHLAVTPDSLSYPGLAYAFMPSDHLREGSNQLAIEYAFSSNVGDPLELFDVSVTNDGVAVLSSLAKNDAVPTVARQAALQPLGSLTDQPDVAALLREMVAAGDESMKRIAMKLLATSDLSPEQTLSVLLEVLRDPNVTSLHETAIEAIGHLGPKAASAIPEIKEYINGNARRPRGQVASSAWVTLLRIAPDQVLGAEIPASNVSDVSVALRNDAWRLVVEGRQDRSRYEWALHAALAADKLAERGGASNQTTSRYYVDYSTRVSDKAPSLSTVLGACYYRVEQYRDAVSALETAHNSSGGNPAELFVWAMALQRLGEAKQAEAKMTAALELMRSKKWRDDVNERAFEEFEEEASQLFMRTEERNADE